MNAFTWKRKATYLQQCNYLNGIIEMYVILGITFTEDSVELQQHAITGAETVSGNCLLSHSPFKAKIHSPLVSSAQSILFCIQITSLQDRKIKCSTKEHHTSNSHVMMCHRQTRTFCV